MNVNIEKSYKRRHDEVLQELAERLQIHILDLVSGVPRIDRVTARAKSPARFLEKAMKEIRPSVMKYDDPLRQIQDQVGARVVVFYLRDVETVAEVLNCQFRLIEAKDIVPESVNEFGYVGKHFVFFVPRDVINPDWDEFNVPKFFELQIKTLFQHAWGEANHDLGYKPETPLDGDQKRRIAFTAAQAWGADMVYQELFNQLRLAGNHV